MLLISDATAARLVDSLHALRAALPEPRRMTYWDPVLGFLIIALHILALLPPPTRGWRLARAALAPFIAGTWIWLGYVPILRTRQDRWGSNLLFCESCLTRAARADMPDMGAAPSRHASAREGTRLDPRPLTPGHFAFRAFEHLVVFPPEFEVYRLRPRGKPTNGNGHGPAKMANNAHPTLEPEPIPAPWTWAKLEWAASLWWSWRGIGWNYAPSLTESQARPPFTRDTPRRQHLIYRALCLLGVYAVDSAAARYMLVGMPQFFVTHTLKYADLTTRQRAAVSLATVARILASLEFSHLQLGLVAVAVGELFGLEGELWEPWGWPAMFGSLQDIWRNPGLNYVWAKVRGHVCIR